MSSPPDKRGPKRSRVLKLTASEHAQLTARGYNVREASHLGGGRSGDVYRITHYSRPIAVKPVFVEQPVTYRARLLFGEIYAATRIPRHPHIVQFYDVLGFQYGVLIFMELAPGGNLFNQSQLAARGYKLSPGKPLGKGGYGVVYRASHFEYACAVKVMDVSGMVRDYPFTWAWIHQELSLMKVTLKHTRIVQVYDLFVTEQKQLLVFMEFAEGGCLYDRIFESPRLTEDDSRKYYAQFGSALMYMHSLGFAHRDIKPENVLLDASKQVCKVTDFGLSKRAFDVATGREHLSRPGLGTFRFCAPEVLEIHIFGRANCARYGEFKADVWGAGVVLFMMLLRGLPFKPNRNYPKSQEDDKLYLYEQQLHLKYRIYLTEYLSNDAIRMVQLHFVINPRERPTFYDLFQCEPWLRQCVIKS